MRTMELLMAISNASFEMIYCAMEPIDCNTRHKMTDIKRPRWMCEMQRRSGGEALSDGYGSIHLPMDSYTRTFTRYRKYGRSPCWRCALMRTTGDSFHLLFSFTSFTDRYSFSTTSHAYLGDKKEREIKLVCLELSGIPWLWISSCPRSLAPTLLDSQRKPDWCHFICSVVHSFCPLP